MTKTKIELKDGETVKVCNGDDFLLVKNIEGMLAVKREENGN